VIPAAIGPNPAAWRLRVAVGAAAALGLLAIGGGMSAGLETASRWTNGADAAVIPDVLYLEKEDAQLATIARVNDDIAREVTVDVAIDDLARRAAKDSTRTSPTAVDAPADARGNAGSNKDDATAVDPAAGADTPGSGTTAGGNDHPRDTTATGPAETTKPADEPKPGGQPTPTTTAPAIEPEPVPTEPTRGNGTPQNDKPRERDPKVDGKSLDPVIKESIEP
jgi:hypothetical protein